MTQSGGPAIGTSEVGQYCLICDESCSEEWGDACRKLNATALGKVGGLSCVFSFSLR